MFATRRRLRATLAALMATACALFAGAGPVVAEGLDAPARYRLDAGDRIEVTVYGHEDLSGTYELDGGGSIAFPLVGPIALGGLTLRQAEAAIVGRLRPDYLKHPRVGLQVLNYRPFYILGEVKKPGSYPYRQGLTVMEAVALAGGYTYRADDDDLQIVRGRATERAPRAANERTRVLPGDTIRVPERFF